MQLHIRLSSGVRFRTEFAGTTCRELKEWLASEHECGAVEQLRLVFKGRILADADVLGDSGIQSGSTLFLVVSKKSGSSGTEDKKTAAVAGASNTSPPVASTSGTNAAATNPPALSSVPTRSSSSRNSSSQGTAPTPFGINSDPNNNRATMADPAADALNNPILQGMLEHNPEFLTNLMQQQMESNPAMRRLMEQNPILREVLNDPQELRRMLQMQANPALRQQQQRLSDLALSR